MRFLETQRLGVLAMKHTVDRDHMKMQISIEQGAEAVNKHDGADARPVVALRQTLQQTLFEGVQKAVQHGGLQFSVVKLIAAVD